jgi:glycosyltransferase involved in cell wall biosynthesis
VKTTVITIGCYPSTGGPSKSVRAFQRALNAQVIAWVDPREYALEKLVFEPTAIVRGVQWPALRTLLYPRREDLPAAEELVASSDLVSCHLFWRWHCPWLQTVAGRYQRLFWLVPHGGLDPYVFQKNGFAKRMFAKTIARPFLTSAPAVVCSTRREYEKARRHLPRAEPFILPWPLEEADVRDRDHAARHATRGRLGIPENAFCLLYLGRLHGMKRPLETITALARSGVSKAHLLIVGNAFGVSLDDCIAHAQNEGVEDRVHVVGAAFGNSKRAYFDAADAYISLSHRENFNFSAAEALASGLPVILSPGNDLASDLAPIDCGWMLPSIEAAPEAIRAASELPATALADRGRRGKEWAENTLPFATFAAKLRGYAARLAEEVRR